MSSTRSRRHRTVCTDPLHVVEGPDGTVVVFFPDGRSVALTVEAAARSTLSLARTVRSANERAINERAVNERGNGQPVSTPRATGTVVAVDFGAASRLH